MVITLEDAFWNVNPKYEYIDIFNDFNKVTLLHLWFSFITYGFWFVLFVFNIAQSNDVK